MNVFYSLLTLLQRFVSNRWSQALGVASLLTGMLWFYLPLMTFFMPVIRRLIVIGVVWVVVFAIAWFVQRRSDKQERALDAAVTDGGANNTKNDEKLEQVANEEVKELRQRLQTAIATLRKRGVRRLYDLPWYVLIGPPGAGKTTALRKSGLHFPLEESGETALQGVGGTRLCDWWFADEAVLIDTAGRYTTQDSARAVDRAGWLGFLDSLRKVRSRQPINGVIVMISVLDMVSGSPETREMHAQQVRMRINEVTEKLGVRIPVYLIFNKIDRLAGFEAFFEDLDVAGRQQVWGMTFPVGEGIEHFNREFDELIAHLDRRLIDRLQAERAPDRRAIMSGFPLQVASLSEPIQAFLEVAFRGSRIDKPPFLRGVYLTSATQVGAPLDRLSGALARSFGIDQHRSERQNHDSARGYFLTRLMRDVILGESLLGVYAPERYRKRRRLRIAAFGVIGVVSVLAILLIWQGHRQARQMEQQELQRFAAYHDAVAPVIVKKIDHDSDLPAVSDALDQAEALKKKPQERLAGLLRIGSTAAAYQAGEGTYESALTRLLYPRLLWRIEQDMREHFQDPAYLYDATRVYLLLGGLGSHDRGLVTNWFVEEWARRYPGALNNALRARLKHHLEALLALPAPMDATLDGDLVRRARIAFGHVTPAQRIYSRLRDLPIPADMHDWSPQEALGSMANPPFIRRSNAPLSDGVPAFYTGAGYAQIVRQQLPAAARDVANESWVVGHDTAMDVRGSDAAALEADVARLWTEDARQHWSSTLNDLAIALGNDPRQISGSLYLLSSPQSPLRDMVRSIVVAQTIPMPGDDKKESKNATVASHTEVDPNTYGPIDRAALEWNASLKSLADMLTPSGGGTPPMDTVTGLIGQLDEAMEGTGSVRGAPAGVGMPDPTERLRAEASRRPEPISSWLREIADMGQASRAQEAKASASGAFNGEDGPSAACHALVKKHFPFDPRATEDAPLDQFVRVFAPGGLFDRYIEQSVAPYTDQTGRVWRLHDAGGVHAPFTPAQLAAFQKVSAIRDTFFPAAGAPFLSLTITFHSDSDMVLKLGNMTIHSDQPAMLSWPGSDGLAPAVITRTLKGQEQVLERGDGLWGVVHLLQKGYAQGNSILYPDGETISVRGSKNNSPFNILFGFTCPEIR
ncbi:type VI secretion system membrane subunit TssM [Swingsia samuiensis]|uniref:Type VI secretion system membrane subunit TssM n=1 Tax=Swingsia samuiensis TaxID=1293412 RepID=A0A4Y6UI28_9PROT|nr:type VI secretion system membrane subunit TssM [Swingsia samuiensis]QDH16318.1 type VI secretion system membrane subunit TssM [Swingsia samuiensis]